MSERSGAARRERRAYREGGRERSGGSGAAGAACIPGGRERAARSEGAARRVWRWREKHRAGSSDKLSPSFDPTRRRFLWCGRGARGGGGVQWEAEGEPWARMTGSSPEQAQMARIVGAQTGRLPAQMTEERRGLQLARQLARRPGKETVSWCHTISIHMLTVSRWHSYHWTDDT